MAVSFRAMSAYRWQRATPRVDEHPFHKPTAYVLVLS
jgi:hypothetical protein